MSDITTLIGYAIAPVTGVVAWYVRGRRAEQRQENADYLKIIATQREELLATNRELSEQRSQYNQLQKDYYALQEAYNQLSHDLSETRQTVAELAKRIEEMERRPNANE
jgi:septal ring factor EnvC (AmiA/AmiB activator)